MEKSLDARRGFEPRSTESESVVLPLNDRATEGAQLAPLRPGVKAFADAADETGDGCSGSKTCHGAWSRLASVPSADGQPGGGKVRTVMAQEASSAPRSESLPRSADLHGN